MLFPARVHRAGKDGKNFEVARFAVHSSFFSSIAFSFIKMRNRFGITSGDGNQRAICFAFPPGKKNRIFLNGVNMVRWKERVWLWQRSAKCRGNGWPFPAKHFAKHHVCDVCRRSDFHRPSPRALAQHFFSSVCEFAWQVCVMLISVSCFLFPILTLRACFLRV